MNNEKELQKMVNPVGNTAVTTLALKAAAGLKRAGEVYMRLGFADAPKRDDGPDDLTKLCFVAIHDMRHEAVDRMIKETGMSYVFDLPCGYTHRALDMADLGIKYIGGDLPAVISDIRPVIEAMADSAELEKISFAEVDVTDPDSMRNAVRAADGEICIATEGLTVYLNKSELALLMENVAKLLSEKGGCWLITDPETLAYYMAVITSIAGERSKAVMDYAAKSFSAQSDVDILSTAAALEDVHQSDSTNLHGGVDYESLERTCNAYGLRVEKVPYFRGDLELSVYRMMPEDAIAKMKEAMKKINVWKLTFDAGLLSTAQANDLDKKEEFRVTAGRKGSELHMKLSGRIDTLTAPEFLKAWESEGKDKGVSAVIIDCADMQYISSAGLRVMLIISKALPDSGLRLRAVSTGVREILETTGFIDFLELEN
ncbi:STAS domain-containing protein [Lachnospiraceae bacterium C1.1]|nr:STAS domain-containing protein [Lachnospiraceae bacterium C1.1]